MPGRRVHKALGASTGAVWALHNARGETGGNQVLEALGGAVAGALGGCMPDLLEPATSPNHRSTCHSVAITAALGIGQYNWLSGLQTACREKAKACRESRTCDVGLLARLLSFLQEILWRLLAGAAAGFGAGWVSHTFADAFTPKCVPAC